MKRCKWQLVCSAGLLLCNLAQAYNGDYWLAVVEENAHHVSLYNPESGERLGSVGVGALPHEIELSADGKTAWVSNFGIRDYDSGSGTPGASVSVIDLPTMAEKSRLYTFNPSPSQPYDTIDSAPHGVKLRPHTENELFVNVEKGAKVLVYDAITQALVRSFAVNPNTHNLFFSADGKTLWLMAAKDGIIRVDPDTGEERGSLTLGSAVRGLKYTPDGQYLMASAVNQVALIDPASLKVVRQFDNLDVGPVLYSDITPDNRYIIAPAPFDHQVVVIEVDSGKVIHRFVTGLNPMNVAVSPDGQYAFVSNATDRHLSRIDLEHFEMTRLKTREGPNGLAFIKPFALKPHKALTFGVALPFTGADSVKGREMMRGYEYWRTTLMKAGGLMVGDEAYNVRIVYLDSASKPENVAALTRELIEQHHVDALLSTVGDASWEQEKAQAERAHIAITPKLQEPPVWQSNHLAAGLDYFITTALYEQGYVTQYNFKPTAWSAMATATGLLLQNAVASAGSLDAQSVNTAFLEHDFHLFYLNREAAA